MLAFRIGCKLETTSLNNSFFFQQCTVGLFLAGCGSLAFVAFSCSDVVHSAAINQGWETSRLQNFVYPNWNSTSRQSVKTKF